MYPSPATNSDIAFTSENVVTETIITPQTYTQTGTTLKPDMDYAYMYAAVETETSSSVTLSFKPMYTAFQVTVDSGEDATMIITEFKLTSASKAMAGQCTATITASTTSSSSTVSYTGFPTATDANKSIVVSFGTGGITITKGSPIVFTVFALPQDYSDLTASFTTPSGTKSLKLKDLSGNWVTFSAGYKYNLNGLELSGSWEYHLGELQDVTLTYAGGSGQLSKTTSFVSYKTNGSRTVPVAYKLQYCATNSSDDADWSDTQPSEASWFTVETPPSAYTGSVGGESITLRMDPQVNSAVDEHQIELAKTTRIKTDYFDLSLLNVATSGWIEPTLVDRSTANCYVVQGSGSFKFPLVYGNGVMNGAVNEDAYRAKAGPSATSYRPDDGVTNFLGSFKDHLDNNIYNGGEDPQSSPYLTTHLKKAASDFTPVLIWTDAAGLVTNVGITGTGEDTYITFEVP